MSDMLQVIRQSGAPEPKNGILNCSEKSKNDDDTRPQQDPQSTCEDQKLQRSCSMRLLTSATIIKLPPDPKDCSRHTKLFITIMLTLSASIDPLASTSFYPALHSITTYFHVSSSIANLCSSLDFLGVALSALYWSHASYSHGRKTLLTVSLLLSTIFAVIGASATSIVVLIISRVCSSASAAGVIVVGAALVSDMWDSKEKGFAMGLFFAGPLTSLALGPILGGCLTERGGWRAVQIFVAAWAVVMTIVVVLGVPETRGRQSQGKPTTGPERDAGSDCYHGSFSLVARIMTRTVVDPIRSVAYLQYPIVSLPLYLAAFQYGLTAISSITIQSTYSNPPYSYNSELVGLMFLPYALSGISASLLGGKWSDRILRQRRDMCNKPAPGLVPIVNHSHASEASHRSLGSLTSPRPVRSQTRDGIAEPDIEAPGNDTADSQAPSDRVMVPAPELRLGINAWVSFGLAGPALVGLGWALHARPLWVLPIIPSAVLGMSAALNLNLVTTILVEVHPHSAASLMALNSVGRNLCGAIGGSVAQPLLDRIGVGWLFTGLGVWAIGNLLVVGSIRRKGKTWRESLTNKEIYGSQEWER